jgi:amidase
MSGHPALTLPAGCTAAGMPIGMQLVGGAFQETALLRAGVAYQAATDWHRRHPALPHGPAQ